MNKNLIKSTIIGVIFSGGLFAQTESTSINEDENTDKYKVETNHFFDNWFISGGIGASIYFGDHNRQLDIKNRIASTVDLNIGKWFTPVIGLRLGYNGGKIKGATQGPHSTGEAITEKPFSGYWLYYSKFSYTHLHGDVLFNLKNLFGGYDSDRKIDITTYLGAGYIATQDKPKEQELTLNAGLYATYKLSEPLSLALDVRQVITNDRFDGTTGQARLDGITSATIGIVYKFNKRDWDRGSIKTVTKTIDYSSEELNKVREKADALEKANDALKRELAEAKNKPIPTKTQTIVDRSVLAPPLLITFGMSQTSLSKEARVNLGYFAKIVKSKPGIVYTITGYADKGTGSAQVNEKLSRERAQVVYDALIKEFGVNPAQLKTNFEGGVDTMFYDDPRLSRSVVAFETKQE